MRRSVPPLALLAACLLATLAAQTGRSGEKRDAPVGNAAAEQRWQTVRPVIGKDTKFGQVDYISFTQCDGCHTKPSDAFKAEKRTDFVYLTESTTWRTLDLHSYAYTALGGPNPDPDEKNQNPKQGELGRRMNRLLGWKTPDGKPRNVWESAECLACHSVDKHPELSLDKKQTRIIADGRKAIVNLYITGGGVGCEACHGPANAWNNEHVRAAESAEPDEVVSVRWRSVSPHDKFAVGQIDLRDPKLRTQVCASCHVGNAEEGKFVTHEMYAAGHPPLPAFEAATFARDQPFHAWPVDQVKYIGKLAAKKPQSAWELFHYRTDEDPVVRLAAVGAITTFRESMALLRGETAEVLSGHGSSGGALDFSNFDCYACHHDLKVDSDRQKRGYEGVPGRPRMRPAATALLDAVIDHAVEALGDNGSTLRALDGELKAQRAALNRAFDARVYGDPGAVQEAADKLVGLTDKVLAEVEKVKYTPKQTGKLLDRLVAAVNAKDRALYDYDAARQLAWVIDELARKQYPNNAQVAEALHKLGEVTPLQLRPTDKRVYLDNLLPGRYDRIYHYESKDFLNAFAGLEKLLKQ